jgi:Zn-dependent protease
MAMHAISWHWLYPEAEGFALGMVALALHEAGHALAALAVGVRVKGIGLNWKGLYLRREAGTPGRNLVISAAGPMTNLLLVTLWAWWPVFGLANACFMLFNILPLPGADGERVARCWLQIQAARSAGKPVESEKGGTSEEQAREKSAAS